MCKVVSFVLVCIGVTIGAVSAAVWWAGKDAIGKTMDIVSACAMAAAAITFGLSFICCTGGGDEDEDEDTTTHSSV